MTARLVPVLVLFLAFAVAAEPAAPGGAPPALGGASPPRDRDPGPFPLVLLDPGDYPVPGLDAPSSTALGRHLAWQPINWRINSDLTNEVQNEEQVVVNPLDPDNLVAIWRDFRLGHRRVGIGYSFDAGITWHDTLLEEPSYPRHSDPGLTFDSAGNIYAVILSYTGSTSDPNGLFVFKSDDGGVTWGDPVPAVDGVPGVFEDKELIACDRTGGDHDGNLYVVWDRFGWDTQIMSVRSTDGGASFQTPVPVSDLDGVQWPCPVVGPDGTVYVAWTQYWPSSIRIDRSFDGGVTFGTDITVASTYTPYTEINGGIAVFAFPAMECDTTGGPLDGRLYVAYMDAGGGDFDIFCRHSDDRGVTWSSPVRVNDDAYGNGCDQFHPWTCVSDDGVVNVIFLDRRNDPSNLLMDAYLAQSFDGGASFGANIRVSTVSSDPTAGSARAGLLGEYIGLAASSSARVHPVWTDTREGNQDVYTSIIDSTFVGVPEDAPIGSLCLLPPRPTPSSGSVEIAYLSRGGKAIHVSVFDLSGRIVREFDEVPGADGRGSIGWDGTDRAGEKVASGVYFVRASDGVAAAAAKVVLVR